MNSPFLLRIYFQLIDDRNVHQRIYLGSYSREGTPVPLSFRWPLTLSNNWQYFCLDLADVTKRVFRTHYVETVKIKVNIGGIYR